MKKLIFTSLLVVTMLISGIGASSVQANFVGLLVVS